MRKLWLCGLAAAFLALSACGEIDLHDHSGVCPAPGSEAQQSPGDTVSCREVTGRLR